MLDQLLGRAELKDRIEELREENERLENRIESADRRRAEAVSARQAADERVNRLEDRVAELEGRIDREADPERELSVRGREPLRGERLDAVLARLRSVDAGAEGALTAYVEDGSDLPSPVREAFGERAALVARASPCLAVADDAGVVSAALRPPMPPEAFAEWADGFALEPSWFRPEGSFAFALVRSDLFALGEYDGGERTDREAIESDVMGAHSKGGFSQARFERRRDEQVDAHLRQCREAIERRDPDRLILVGDRAALGSFESLADRTATVDATGDPEAALEDAFRAFWTTRLFLI